MTVLSEKAGFSRRFVTTQPSNTVMPAGKRASSHMDVNDLPWHWIPASLPE